MKVKGGLREMKETTVLAVGILIAISFFATGALVYQQTIDLTEEQASKLTVSQKEAIQESGPLYERYKDTDIGIPEAPEKILGDFNGDGVKNSRDFIAFLNAYVAGDSKANMDFDEVVDERDFWVYYKLYVDGKEAAEFNGDNVKNSKDFVAFLNSYGDKDRKADMNRDGNIDEKDFSIYYTLFRLC